jgi:FhuF-like iron-sulfur protein
VTNTALSPGGSLSSDLTAFGPFFSVETHVRGGSVPPQWQPMTVLIADTDVLTARVVGVRAALAHGAGRQPEDVDIRVAASVAHLGLVARLLAPMLGAIALGHPPLPWSPDDLWWQNTLGGPYPLSVTPQPATRVPGPGPAVEAITAAMAERYRVSRHVLWGNIGSAANSAARLICTARPELTATAHGAADAFLADPRIDGGAVRAGPLFRRRSCCLIYRIANDRGAACGDCILK